MNQSENIGALAKALSAAQGMMKPAELDGRNPQFRSKYATLGAVIEAIRPILATNGLAFTQHVSRTEAGEIEVTTCVMHESGEWMASTLGVPFGDSKGVTLVQAMGSVTTYIKRYGLTSMFGVYGDEDVDGNEQGTPAPQSARAAVAERQAAAGRPMPGLTPSTDEQFDDLEPAPQSASHWINNPAARSRFWAWTKNEQLLTEAEVHEALGVEHVRDYQGSMADAKVLLINRSIRKEAEMLK